MAAPLIQPNQSAPGTYQWQMYGFQPYATNSPTLWSLAGGFLPLGMALNPTSGLVSGTPTLAGVYNFALMAYNSDGWSPPVLFTIGVIATSPLVPGLGQDVIIDLASREARFAGADKAGMLWVSRGDDLIFQIVFLRGTVAADLDLVTLKFALKLEDPDVQTIVSGADFVKLGSGTDTVYRLHAKAASTALSNALEEPAGESPDPLEKRIAFVTPLGQFEWVANNATGVGTTHARGSSRIFTVTAFRDLIADAAPLT